MAAALYLQYYPLYLRESLRRLSRRASPRRLVPFRFASAPDRLIVAPTDLRIADPYIAEEFHLGRFPLAGRILVCEGVSPFELDGPTPAFDAALHGFRWLRHLRAADSDTAYQDARLLTEDWISLYGRRQSGVAWDPDVTAQRLIAWLSHSPIILKNMDRAFYKRFVRSIALQIRYLRRIAGAAPDGEVRFRIRVALAMASLATPASPARIKSAARALDNEIARQILPDGGHISRNPHASLALLADLLPLRQTYLNLGHTPPSKLVTSIDRMFQALRFFRHTEGTLALFNGARALPADRLLSVLRYDETAGQPLRHAPQLKYQRLSNSDTIVIADTGPLPPVELSTEAGAGCLSFEMSSGRNRFIVNAGAPAYQHAEYSKLSRTTAAHSTLTIGDSSSAAMSTSAFLGPMMINGPKVVEYDRTDDSSGRQGFVARHDGYAKTFGLIHERSIQLSADGNIISGRDRLLSAGKQAPNDTDLSATVRFHIHPNIEVTRDPKNNVVLRAADGECWTFFCPNPAPVVEDDVFFADLVGPRRSEQIALTIPARADVAVGWTLVRTPVRREDPDGQ